MKKLFLLISILPVLVLSLAFTFQVKAQDTRPRTTSSSCPAGWTLSADGFTCTSPDGQKIPAITGSSDPFGTPAANTPAPAPTPSGTVNNGGKLPDCTDNYDSGQICLPKSPVSNCTGIACSGSIVDLAAKIINILLYFAGVVAVIFVIIGGYRYMTAGGNQESATAGRRTMTQAIIGLIIVILAYVIVTAVTNFLIK